MKVKIFTDSPDHLGTNLLILPFFSDTKLLKGTIGFVDWRLNGFLSRLFMQGKIRGDYFEKILIPPFERIAAERILLVCIGRRDEFNEARISDLVFRLMETVYKISFSSFSISLPVEIDKMKTLKEMIEHFFRGIDKFAVKVGPSEFLENLRITFALDREKLPATVDVLNGYLSSRRVASQALINA